MPAPRILVVDDDAPNRALLREILVPLGYEVGEAADGDEALEKIARETPDLVLLDVVMPRLDGTAVCRAIKSDPRTRLLPVVMLTSLDQLPVRVQANELGADDFLTKPFNVAELTARVRSLVSLKRYTDELEHAARVLEGVALVVERRDPYTGDHCRRLGEYGARVGAALGLGEEDQKVLRLGGVFHDLGKIAVPDVVLHKPGCLTPEEFEVIKTHPGIGYDLCRPMRTLEKMLPLIRHHHEKLDGSGYPDRLSGSQIQMPVRVITVVDVYDALATDRPYKKAFPRDRCFAILRDGVEKGWWDREVVETLDRVV